MKTILIPALLALGLSGCAGLDNFLERDPAREVIAACGAITGALNVLTPNKHRLTEEQIATVDMVVDSSEPICTAEDPPADQLALIESLGARLATIQSNLIEGE